MDNNAHRKISKLKKLVLRVSIIMLTISLFITLISIYIGFAEPRDGDFCDLVQANYNENYDFLISEGVGCKFLFSGLKEPIAFFIISSMALQTPLWATYFLFKALKKPKEQILKTN